MKGGNKTKRIIGTQGGGGDGTKLDYLRVGVGNISCWGVGCIYYCNAGEALFFSCILIKEMGRDGNLKKGGWLARVYSKQVERES